MRILFLCGSVEPGRDGVGDYTLKLARGLATEGYNVRILAINEKNSINDGRTGSSKINTYRLSNNSSWQKRQKSIIKIIRAFTPEIVSLQFVPNSFNKKGLPYFLPGMVQKLQQNNFQWHIMFHELWIANHRANSIKEFLIREAQKIIIKKLIKRTGKAFIDTSNAYYKKMLKSLDVESGISPVFSNIPRAEKQNIDMPVKNRGNKIVCILFGNIQYSNSLSTRLLEFSNEIYRQLRKKVCILQLGINRDQRSAQVLLELSQILQIKFLGFRDDLEVAKMMVSSDVGLSNHLPQFINKSGSISSMLYNDLPVILLNETDDYVGNLGPEIQLLENISNFKSFINQKKEFSHKYSADHAVQHLKNQFDVFEKVQV